MKFPIKTKTIAIPKSKYGLKCPYEMQADRIVIHNTANSASAENEAIFSQTNDWEVSSHIYVDEAQLVLSVPFNRNAWHAGDGSKGPGNRKGISIEICRSTSDAQTFARAERNGAIVTAHLLKTHGWDMSKVTKHQDYSGKYCPHKTLDLGWDRFLKMVEKELRKDGDKPGHDPLAFIGKIAPMVVAGQKHIFPSVSLAQACLESDYGTSDLAIHAHNLFGIKAKDWMGPVYTKESSEYSWGKFIRVKSDFRKYSSWEESIADHESFFVTPDWRRTHYKEVLKAKKPDDQARALVRAGYATDPAYGDKIIGLINQYDLKRYDRVQAPRQIKYAVCYTKDPDLATAQVLVNAIKDPVILAKTSDARSIRAQIIIQVGASPIKGADLVLAGVNRILTLNQVNKWVQDNLR